jgi:hypothetical protein
MAQRWVSFAPVIVGVCAGFGIGLMIMGFQPKVPVEAQTASAATNAVAIAPPPATQQAPATHVPVGERTLDTSTPVAAAATPAPVTTFRPTKVRKPGSDENLPSWVPLRGRLSVVEAPDLAENLGVVPKGTTKSSSERLSVADVLE